MHNSEKTLAISTGAVYKFSDPGNISRLLTTLDLAEKLTEDGEFGPVGVEIMLLRTQPINELLLGLRTDRTTLNRLVMLGKVSIHADLPEINNLNYPPHLAPQYLSNLKALANLTRAKHVAYHASWGYLEQILDNDIPFVLEQDDSVSGNIRSAHDLFTLHKEYLSAKFLFDTAHAVENFGDQAIEELKTVLTTLAPHLLAYHVSATEVKYSKISERDESYHIPLADTTKENYRSILRHLPKNAHIIIESPIPPENSLEAMKTEMRLALAT